MSHLTGKVCFMSISLFSVVIEGCGSRECGGWWRMVIIGLAVVGVVVEVLAVVEVVFGGGEFFSESFRSISLFSVELNSLRNKLVI